MGRMFGRVDDEGDGFDDVELTRILNIVSGLPAVSERIKQAAQAGNSWLFDLVLCSVTWRNLSYNGPSGVLLCRSSCGCFSVSPIMTFRTKNL